MCQIKNYPDVNCMYLETSVKDEGNEDMTYILFDAREIRFSVFIP